MKYFAIQTRPKKIDGFQFRKKVVFEVSSERALHFYHEWCKRQNEATYDGEAYVLFDHGTSIQVCENSVNIYGMAWDDKELFTRRLKGEIAAEIWK